MRLTATFRILVGFLLLLGSVACSSEIDPHEAEGGYLRFREALLGNDSRGLWECLSKDTKALFDDALNDPLNIQESLASLSPTDQTIVQERTTVQLLQVADDAETLFNVLVRLENLSGDETYRIGSAIQTLTVAADESTALVLTESNQEIELVKEEDGIWRVSSLGEVIQNALDPIASDVMAVGVMVADSAYMRRSHEEILRLLGSAPTPERPE